MTLFRRGWGQRCLVSWPGGLGAGRQRNGERIEQERDEGVVAAQRDQLDHAGVAEQGAGGVVAGLADLPGTCQLAGNGVDGALVVRLEGRLIAPPDSIDRAVGHALVPCDPRVRPPLELGLPPAPDRDDRHFSQPSLDRRAEPQGSAERTQAPADAGRVQERVERPGQPATPGDKLATSSTDDLVPDVLARGVEVVTAQLWQAGHTWAIVVSAVGGYGRLAV